MLEDGEPHLVELGSRQAKLPIPTIECQIAQERVHSASQYHTPIPSLPKDAKKHKWGTSRSRHLK
jgi:hypothetical protein